jgi:hypothetical protein
MSLCWRKVEIAAWIEVSITNGVWSDFMLYDSDAETITSYLGHPYQKCTVEECPQKDIRWTHPIAGKACTLSIVGVLRNKKDYRAGPGSRT